MQVKILVPLSGDRIAWSRGDTPHIVDAKGKSDPAEAARLIKAGYAEPFTPEKATKTAPEKRG